MTAAPDETPDYETLETFGYRPEHGPSGQAPSADVAEDDATGYSSAAQGGPSSFADALTAPQPEWEPDVPDFPDVPHAPGANAGGYVVAAPGDSPAIAAAFTELSRAEEFERQWSEKFKLSHVLMVVVALAVVPLLAAWLLFS